MSKKIYIVATPIGNLEDITLRAIKTLKEVDVVFAEDTRVAKKLLSHLNISKPVKRFDDNISDARIEKLVEQVLMGKSAVVVSDAGTPNLSDPGWKLIKLAIEKEVKVIPIPGASALTALLSISHFPVSNFLFLGFPPAKKKRKKFFNQVSKESYPIVLYESPHRILKTLEELSRIVPSREVVVAKELTKIHENIWRGGIREVCDMIKEIKDKERKGEWTLIINS